VPLAKLVKYSVLDLAPIVQGSTASQAFAHAQDLAKHAEDWGYHRYWLAEHHNIPGVASAATSILIAHVASVTSRIRVGSGGIMLPNHAPLVIAEQFGTLASLYPGRIDLGLGRAPGGDHKTSRALRRTLNSSGDTFPQDLQELRSYFQPGGPGNGVHAVPGEGLDVPIYLLGSSDFGARLAAQLGLPFAFASHFAPDYLFEALNIYRSEFKPSDSLKQPYAMVGVNVFSADTDDEAHRLSTSLKQAFLNLIRGRPTQLLPAVDSMDRLWNSAEEAHVSRMTWISAIGGVDQVVDQLQSIIQMTGADELIITGAIYDHKARLRSYQLASQAMLKLQSQQGVGAA
jgi:luciferase family oxidoreductase group 1